jgi:hypothetical protein
MSHFWGYCLHPVDGTWAPRGRLDSAEAAYHYWVLHHIWAPEVRITDEHDFLVLHVEDHVRKCPMPDGSLRETRL